MDKLRTVILLEIVSIAAVSAPSIIAGGLCLWSGRFGTEVTRDECFVRSDVQNYLSGQGGDLLLDISFAYPEGTSTYSYAHTSLQSVTVTYKIHVRWT